MMLRPARTANPISGYASSTGWRPDAIQYHHRTARRRNLPEGMQRDGFARAIARAGIH